MTEENQEVEVSAISLSMRIPPFWRDKPRLWFISFEAATSELKKSQTQLAQMVVAKLEKQDIEQIADLLYNPPKAEQYEVIKKRLITTYEESDNRQFQKLLSEMELGTQKPSQLLRRMKNLAREKIPDATLRLMWSNHLPAHIRSVLAVSESINPDTKLDEISLLADTIAETSCSQVSTIATSLPESQTEETFNIMSQLKRLSREIAELKSRPQYDNRPTTSDNTIHCSRCNLRSRARQNSQSPPRFRHGSPLPYCYYHQRFGTKAVKCTPPCSFKKPQEKLAGNGTGR